MTPIANDERTLFTVSELEQHYGREALVCVTVDDPELVEAELAGLPRRRYKAWLLLVLCVTTGAAVLLGYAWSRHRSARR